MLGYLKAVIMVQLFWALAMTLIVYSLPVDQLDSMALFANTDNNSSMAEIGAQVQGSADDQFNVPFLDFATLIYYSSNLFFTLVVNFAFAVPQMMILLFSGIFLFIPVDAVIQTQLKIFIGAVITAIYFLGIIGMMLNLRSGGRVA